MVLPEQRRRSSPDAARRLNVGEVARRDDMCASALRNNVLAVHVLVAMHMNALAGGMATRSPTLEAVRGQLHVKH